MKSQLLSKTMWLSVVLFVLGGLQSFGWQDYLTEQEVGYVQLVLSGLLYLFRRWSTTQNLRPLTEDLSNLVARLLGK